MAALDGARVLVTGAGGFIGSHVVRRLVDEGCEIHAVSKAVSQVYPARLVDLRDAVTVHEANIVDRTAMEVVVERARPTHVLHLAAFTHVGKSWDRVDECLATNLVGTVNLLHALEDSGYQRFVSIGTSEIYGSVDVPFREDAVVRPISPYAASKVAAEHLCRVFHEGRGWPIVLLRPFNAYGPAQSPDRVVPEIIVRALRRQRLAMTEGRQTREFNFVEDIADGIVRAATAPGIDGEILNLGCGEEVSMRDLATQILELMGNPIEPEFGALPERPTEIRRMYSDSSKARTLLGWEPLHTLADGLARTIAWYEGELARPGSPFVL